MLIVLAACGLVVGIVLGTSAGTTHGGTDARSLLAGKPRQDPPRVGPAMLRPPAAMALSTGWSYRADPRDVGLSRGWGAGAAPGAGWSSVSIPNDFNPTPSGRGDAARVGWYKVSFRGPAITSGRAWAVAFESVRRNSEVWLNGDRIGANHDPYVPFRLPATSLKPGQTNTLILRVDNARGAGSFPEDWWNWGGIMGPVALEPTGRIEVQDLGVTPELGCAYRCGGLRVQGRFVNRSATSLAPSVVVRMTSPSGATSTFTHRLGPVRSGAGAAASFTIGVPAPIALWSPSSPSLYRVQVQTSAGGRVEDQETMRVGMRSVRVSRGILYLNGRRLWLHGAAIHEDVQGRGAALDEGDINTIVSELRSVGANITRAHYLLSPRLLDALDTAGIMVWAQPPVDHADAMLRTAGGRARALAMLRATLIANRNHPSVIIDSVANELSPRPDSIPGTKRYIEAAITTARALNPSVPVALDIFCYPDFPRQAIYSKLDVIGISSYFGWYPGPVAHSIAKFTQLEPYLQLQHSRYPRQALAISEFGAESLFAGAAATKGSYDFQSDYLRGTFDVLARLPFMNGAIYWTLREFAVSPGWTGGVTLPVGDAPDNLHHKGLIAYDGTDKPAFAVAQQLFGTTPSYTH